MHAKNNITKASGANSYVSINPADNKAYYFVQYSGNDRYIYDVKVLGNPKLIELTDCAATYFDGLEKVYE